MLLHAAHIILNFLKHNFQVLYECNENSISSLKLTKFGTCSWYVAMGLLDGPVGTDLG